jgi:hypothetical protein
MKKSFIYICLGSLLLTAACDKVLDVDPVSDITNEGYWKSSGDVTGYLTGIYAQMREAFNDTYYLEDRGDAFVAGLEGGMSNAWQQNLNDANAPSWKAFYNLVHHCNLLLKYTPGISFPVQADKDRALAEAYFIRAYTYFWLIRSWGDVPLVLEPTENGSNPPQPSRAPMADVMRQILQDVDAALALFPESGFINKSRASKPACYTLKADALLWKAKVLKGGNQDLEAALAALLEVEKTSGLTLLDNFSQVFATINRNNNEVILSIHFQKDEKNGMYAKQLKPRDIFVQNAVNKNDIAYAKNGARSQYMPSSRIEALFDENPDDKRKNASIIKAIDPAGNIIGAFDNKYRGTRDGEWYYDSDIILYRLGEVFLLEAETLAALNRPGEAVAALNKVRMRAGTGGYEGATDKTSVEKEILNERFRELWLEQKRWPDLLRFHFSGVIDVYSEVPNLKGKRTPLYFPIPKSQIDLNPHLQQTQGY